MRAGVERAVVRARAEAEKESSIQAPKTSETFFAVYDWVSVRIGNDKEIGDMMYPAESLEARFTNNQSKIMLLAAMLESAFPDSTRINKVHMRKKFELNLEFNIRSIEGMPHDAAGAGIVFASAVSKRYGTSPPASRASMKGALRADKHGLWIMLNPEIGQEKGLMRDDGAARNGALFGPGKQS